MQALLDTHALIWWLAGDRRLAKAAQAAIAEEANEIFVSAATGWEIATKVRIGKLPSVAPVAGKLPSVIAMHGFKELPVSLTEGERAGLLPGDHRDPFDRMLIAQAQVHGLTLISNEKVFDNFGIRRLW